MSLTDNLRMLEPGWDSYSAIPVTDKALAVAEAIERGLTFVPSVDGGFQVEFHAGGIDCELSVGGDGELAGFHVERVER